jgi:hypothetical protein
MASGLNHPNAINQQARLLIVQNDRAFFRLSAYSGSIWLFLANLSSLLNYQESLNIL